MSSFNQNDQPQRPAGPSAGRFNRNDRPVRSTGMQNLTAFFQGANRMGARMLGLPGDIAATGLQAAGVPIEGPVGSELLTNMLAEQGGTFTDINQVPREQRPAALMGEVVMAGTPFLMGPAAAVRAGMGGRTLMEGGRRVTPGLLGRARAAPGMTAAEETAALGGAAVGRGIAEAVDPGDEGTGLMAEIAGGMLSPHAVALRHLPNAVGSMSRRIRASLSRAGREDLAARHLSNTLASVGEDPGQIASRLREEGFFENAGSAEIAGSRALAAVQNKIASNNPRFNNQQQQRLRQTFAEIEGMMQAGIEAGDDNLVRMAAEARQAALDNLLGVRIADAARAAQRPGFGAGRDGSEIAISAAARGNLEDVLKEARTAERALWGAVPQDVPIAPTITRRVRDSVQEQFNLLPKDLPKDRLPKPVWDLLRRTEPRMQEIDGQMVEIIPEITSGEMLRFRSQLLDEIRNMRGAQAPDFRQIRVTREVADAILDDLADVPGTEAARAFSRTLNDRFTRGTVGDVLRFNVRGSQVVPPEETLSRTVGRGGAAGARASRELEEAAMAQGLTGPAARAGAPITPRSTMGEQQEFISQMANRLFTREGEAVSQRQLDRFLQDNADLLQRFPGLRDEVKTAADAKGFLQTVNQQNRIARQRIQNEAAFTRLVGQANPSEAIGGVLRGPNPVQGYSQLARMARGQGAETLGGLRSATLRSLVESLGQSRLPGQALERALTQKPNRASPSLLDAMKREGVLSDAQADGLMEFVDAVKRVETSLAGGARDVPSSDVVSMLEDLPTRLIGARIGATSPIAEGTNASLVMAGQTSQALRNALQRIPLKRTEDILIEAIENPQFMADLLERGTRRRAGSPTKGMTRIRAYLLAAPISQEEERRPAFGPPPQSPFTRQRTAQAQ